VRGSSPGRIDEAWKLRAEDFLLLAATALLPWAFGGVDVWALRGAGLLLMLAGVLALHRGGLAGWGLDRDWRWVVPAFGLAAWGAFQVLPLPPAAIRVLSPKAHAVYVEALPGYPGPPAPEPLDVIEQAALSRVPEAVSVALPGQDTALRVAVPDCLSRRWLPLSMEPSATAELVLWYLALLVGFLTLRARFASSPMRRLFRVALCVDAGALAAFGLVQQQWWTGEIFWLRTVLVGAQPFGPYFSPTHFGGVMELAVPLLLGYCASRLGRVGRRAWFEAPFAIGLVGAAVCGVATVAAASKFSAVAIGGSTLALLALTPTTWRTRCLAAGTGAALIAAGAVVASGTHLGRRFETLLASSDRGATLGGRVSAWDAGLHMFQDYPLTGSGFGSFAEVYMSYAPAGSGTYWNQAHNDYIEVLLEGGLVAAGLTLWLAAGFARRAARRLLPIAGGSPTRLGLALGALSLAVHAAVDFNHQIPANGLLFVMVCAMLAPCEVPRPETAEQAP
jgi:O-antigen ligase